MDDLVGRVKYVAGAFALPRDKDGSVSVSAKMHDAIAAALRSYTPAVLHRAVELARKQPWRQAELGPWCFTDESFLALVKKAQDEQRPRTRAARVEPETEAPLSQKEALRASAGVLRALGVKRAAG